MVFSYIYKKPTVTEPTVVKCDKRAFNKILNDYVMTKKKYIPFC